MADECTDITVVEELSVFSHWEEERGTPVECVLDIVPLKEADVSAYLALVKCITDKNLQVGSIVGIGFDGAATFSGEKKHDPRAVFVHCHCHLL